MTSAILKSAHEYRDAVRKKRCACAVSFADRLPKKERSEIFFLNKVCLALLWMNVRNLVRPVLIARAMNSAGTTMATVLR